MEPTNPYQAPSAPVTATETTTSTGVRPARRVRASRGGEWINEAFAAVTQSFVGWLLILMVLGIIYVGVAVVGAFLAEIHFALSYVPSFLLYPFLTVIWGGVMLASHNGPLTFRKVMDGATAHKGPLAVLGVLSSLLSIVTLIPFVLIGATSATQLASGSSAGQAGIIFVDEVLVLVLFGMFTAAIWFAPALVAIGQVSPLRSLGRSFKASFKNFLPFTVFSLLMLVLLIASVLLVGLIFAIVAGVLGFATPFDGLDSAAGLSGIIFGGLFYIAAVFMFVSVTAAAQYASFRDIFAYRASI